jgi:hypothetical protein
MPHWFLFAIIVILSIYDECEANDNTTCALTCPALHCLRTGFVSLFFLCFNLPCAMLLICRPV